MSRYQVFCSAFWNCQTALTCMRSTMPMPSQDMIKYVMMVCRSGRVKSESRYKYQIPASKIPAYLRPPASITSLCSRHHRLPDSAMSHCSTRLSSRVPQFWHSYWCAAIWNPQQAQRVSTVPDIPDHVPHTQTISVASLLMQASEYFSLQYRCQNWGTLASLLSS